ncbi:MAG: NUDIX hydrolase [Phycisphaeraceae bacterium]|nr:MAG: NUDIX hydrolase [Phycisphaeraceae bacterium]
MAERELRDKVVNERVLSEHPAYDAVELTIRAPDGDERTKPAIRHRGAVIIVPLLEQPGRAPRVVLVKNDRVIVGEALLECPAGGIDEGESPAEAAERELTEESGYRAVSLYPIGQFYTSPGMSDEVMHAFVAVGLMHVGQALQPNESMTVHRFAAGELLEKIDSGELIDGKSMLAILMAIRRGYLQS